MIGFLMHAQSRPLAPVLLVLIVLTPMQHPSAAHDAGGGVRSSWGHVGHNVVGKRGLVIHHVHPPERVLSKEEHHRPKFKPGPWKQAYATFYQGGSQSFGKYSSSVYYPCYADPPILTSVLLTARWSLWVSRCGQGRLWPPDGGSQLSTVQQWPDLRCLFRDQVRERRSVVPAWASIPDDHSH